MSAESALYGILAAAPGVTALVGDGAAARIYPDAMPEGAAYPVIVFARSSTEPVVTLDGVKHGEFASFGLQCWGDTRAQADAVADAVEAALLTAGEVPDGREAGYDPETGLIATLLNVTLFV